MTGLEVFRYGVTEVRTVVLNDQPWFVLGDLCDVLDIANIGNVAQRIDPLSIRQADVQNSRGQMRATLVVSEAGMYEVVIRSDKPEAATFRRWITSEVLPALRRTGTYSVPQTREQLLAAAVIEAKAVIAEAQAEIADLTPRADAWDDLVATDGDYAVGDAAKMLARAAIEISPNRLFEYLREIQWTHRARVDGKWRAYADAVTKGYLVEKAQWHHHPRTAERVIDAPQVRVTFRGLERLRARLASPKKAIA